MTQAIGHVLLHTGGPVEPVPGLAPDAGVGVDGELNALGLALCGADVGS